MRYQYKTKSTNCFHSKADLLRVLHFDDSIHRDSEAQLNTLAACFGLKFQPTPELVPISQSEQNTQTTTETNDLEDRSSLWPHHSFYYVSQKVPREEWIEEEITQEKEYKPFTRQDFDPQQVKQSTLDPLPYLPITAWRCIWPTIYRCLSRYDQGHAIDIQALTRKISQGQSIRCLPTQPQRHWHPQAHLWLDMDNRLLPLRQDWYWIADQVTRWRGASGLSVYCLRDGILGGHAFKRRSQKGTKLLPVLNEAIENIIPDQSVPILILTDFGAAEEHAQTLCDAWKRLGKYLKRRNIKPTVLLPINKMLSQFQDLKHYYHFVTLDKSQSASIEIAEIQKSTDYQRALALCSLLLRVEFKLFRHIVRHLGLGVMAELAVCQDSMTQQEERYWYFDANQADQVTQLRQQFLTDDLREIVWDLCRRAHQHLPIDIQYEEHQHYTDLTERLGSDESSPQQKLVQRMIATLQDKTTDTSELKASVQLWSRRMCRRISTTDRKTKEFSLLYQLIYPDESELLSGMDVRTFPEDPSAQIGKVICHQENEFLVIAEPLESDEFVQRAPVFELNTKNGKVQYDLYDEKNQLTAQKNLTCVVGARFEIPSGYSAVFYDDVCIQVLIRIKQDGWCETLMQNKEGLCAVFLDAREKEQSAYWVPANEYFVQVDKDTRVILSIDRGFFWRQSEYLNWRTHGFQKPAWATAIGVDEYGLFADWQYESVVQRMRWIQPGLFWMGSPVEEAGRLSDRETLHSVMLTQGYWLADTACTQSLWEAVMGSNPSRFQGRNLPVEQVSWNDVSEFIDRINQKQLGLDFRLPTEAEWEYACRARTQTPYSFGDFIRADQANYYNEDHYRGEPVSVKDLPPNVWGLYQMHGNVYEWCQDWYESEYGSEAVIDPIGPSQGSSRVLRGGSWDGGARFVRSAYRHCCSPEGRRSDFGFRLARGQNTGSQPVQPETEQSSTGAVAEQATER